MTEQGHLSQAEFFSRLTHLFDSRRAATHGSVFLTQKRFSPPPKEEEQQPDRPTDETPPFPFPFPDLDPATRLPILIRATDGKSNEEKRDKIKISTVVQPDEVEGFFVRYAEICKVGMSGLKKRDRSGRKAKEKKKKRGKGKGDERGEKKG